MLKDSYHNCKYFKGIGGVRGHFFKLVLYQSFGHGELKFFYGIKKKTFFSVFYSVAKLGCFIEYIVNSLYIRKHDFFKS